MVYRTSRRGFVLLSAFIVAACGGGLPDAGTASGDQADRPRVVVTTDPELDDLNSLLRYLLYSADFRTEGLIYASSGVHWKGDGRGTRWFVPGREYTQFGLDLCPCTSWRWAENERFIDDAVEAYAQAWPNLRVHDPDYPSPDLLKSRIRWGNVEFDGDISTDSPGSALIRELLLDDEPGPLYLLAWGGQSTIARALKSIEEEYAETPQWAALKARVSGKAIIQSFGDQDGTHASYIAPNWPGIEYREMATRIYGYGARSVVLPGDEPYLSADWMRQNVSERGPMGAMYRVWGDGKQMVPDDIFDYFGFSGLTEAELKAMGYVVWMPVQASGSWISEGDTSTFMNLVDNGLRSHEDAGYGSWGGRRGEDSGPNGPDPHFASARFFGVAQRDLAARFRWAVTPRFEDANHPPVVAVDGQPDRLVQRGERVTLNAQASDPDQDPVTLRWWQYREVGTYAGEVVLVETADPQLMLEVPADARAGDTIHLIVEATDGGDPALTRYQRVVLKVADRAS